MWPGLVTEEGSAARLVRNTVTNGFGAVLGVGVFLVLTPFLISNLGASAYGVFTLALAFSFLGGYAAFSDLGIEAATARYIAEARADGDTLRVNALASTTMAFFLAAALVIAPLLAASSFLLVDLFNVPERLHDAAIICFAMTGAQLLFEMPARTFFAVLEGAQQFAAFQVCQITRIVAQASLFVLSLVLDLGVAGLGASVALSSAIILGLSRVLAHRAVPELDLSYHAASRRLLRTMLGYGGAVVALRLLATAFRQTDRVIIGALLGVQYVTVYEIANKIQSAAQMTQSIAASALVPATAFARTQLDVLQDMFLRGTAYALAVSLPMVVAVTAFAEPLIRTWIDPKFVSAAGPTRLFAAYLLVTSILVVGTTMVVALGDLRFLLAVNGPTVVLNVVLSLALARPLGVSGVILGSVLPLVAVLPLTLRSFLRRFEIPLTTFARRSLLPQLPGLLVQGAACVPLLWVADRCDSLVQVGLLALLSMLLSVVAFVRLGLSRDHRTSLGATMRAALS